MRRKGLLRYSIRTCPPFRHYVSSWQCRQHTTSFPVPPVARSSPVPRSTYHSPAPPRECRLHLIPAVYRWSHSVEIIRVFGTDQLTPFRVSQRWRCNPTSSHRWVDSINAQRIKWKNPPGFARSSVPLERQDGIPAKIRCSTQRDIARRNSIDQLERIDGPLLVSLLIDAILSHTAAEHIDIVSTIALQRKSFPAPPSSVSLPKDARIDRSHRNPA